MRSRGVLAAGAIVVAALTLTSCSVPDHGAVRLNDDGTVDYVLCYAVRSDVIAVEYLVGDPNARDEADDLARDPGPSRNPRAPVVIEYGVVPPGYDEVNEASDPPARWTWVSTPGGYFMRDDLTVGEWFWNSGSAWAMDLPQGAHAVLGV